MAACFFLRLTYRRDRPCRDPLKRDSGRYAITLIEEGDSKKKKRFITLLEVFNLPLNIYLATEQKKKKRAGLLGQK